MKNVTKSIYLLAIGLGLGLGSVLFFWAKIKIRIYGPETGLGLAVWASILILMAAIVNMVLYFKMWQTIQDANVRMTPGKAVGYLFIPIFNIYWAFQVIWGFSKDFNTYIDRNQIEAEHLPEGLFLTNNILSLLGWIHILGAIILFINYFILLVMISRICDGINAIANQTSISPVQGI